MLQQVKTYRTSDQTLHEDKGKALKHECNLEIRGFIRGALLEKSRRNETLTIPEISELLVEKGDGISSIVNKYRISINRANGQQKKKNTKLSNKSGKLSGILS